jgi:regulator of replication initiation timing
MSESTDKATETEVQEPTTSKQLWGDKYQNNGLPTVATEEPEVSENVKTEPVTEEAPTETETPEPEYLNPEDFENKSFKLNVGGEEVTVNVKDAIRRLQTDKYLTQEGQKLAEERRQLDALKNSVVDKSTENTEEDPYNESYDETPTPKVSALEKQIAEMSKALGNIQQNMAPSVYENNIRAIDAHLKTEGFDDFMEFKPEIEAHFLTFSVEDQARIGELDMINEYKNRKIKKMRDVAVNKSREPAENRQAPLVQVIGGSGTPSSSNTDVDAARYRKAFEKAQDSGNWSEVFRLKEIPNM